MQLRRILHDLRHLRLPEELQHLLHLKLLVITDLDHSLQLLDALLHDGANVFDLFFILLDPRVVVFELLRLIGLSEAEILELQSDAQSTAQTVIARNPIPGDLLDDLLNRHAERFQRRFDDLLLQPCIRARRQTL